ncbi:MAG: UvrABC system protein C [Acetothermia bacterium 64_32]|nr:MAG: UvrABC system protein C [Acetothermia bacterium 64_32]HAF70288.1 excinuclease ABC subunit C [Candidatus Acetothermia bacterium]
MAKLKEKLASLPKAPGVYIFRGVGGEVLYVGKAASLRDRVRSYFQSGSAVPYKVRRLRQKIADLEIIVTSSVAEALILEDALVKKHRPPFNVKLRDDKRYPYLKITREPFPRLQVVRRPQDDGARYFGPYTSAKSMRRALKLAHKLFPIRTCSLDLDRRGLDRPCLLYHIGRCSGPCAGLVSPDEYARYVEGAAQLFEGRVDRVIESLRRQMLQAAAEERFEHAAQLRDQIHALERLRERQAVALPEPVDLDAIGIAVEGERGCGTVLLVRGGRLIAREGFFLKLPPDIPPEEALAEFLSRYYTRATAIPGEVLLPVEVADAEDLCDYLAARRGGRVVVGVPRRGERRRLVEMAERNALLALRRAEAEQPAEDALEALAEELNLSVRPWRIEAYDISNLKGQEATGSMVVFVGGRPRPDAYRRFRVRIAGRPDDYAMMREVITRRLAHGLAELADPAVTKGRFSELPDLILVDGGKGQLSMALQALEEQGLSGIEVVALAKREELVYLPGQSEPVRLPEGSPALKLLQKIRDEAHRFAVDYHRRLRGKRALASLLDSVPGIGPKRRELLLSRFGSLQGLKEASLEELLSVPGLPRQVAERLYKALHP